MAGLGLFRHLLHHHTAGVRQLGAGLFVEPALKISLADGDRDLVLHYQSYSEAPDGFDVVLKDIHYEIYVTLHYAIDKESGILARSAIIENREPKAVTVEQAAAASWSLPAGHYTLNYLTGRWAGEWNLTQEKLQPGERVIESRRGSTGHQANPWFAIQSGEASEEQGEVWFGALAWSGSWRITIEQDQLETVRVTGGYNPFDFGYVLHSGERLETPIFYGGYAAHGLGEASRLLHRFELEHILPRTAATASQPLPKPRPVIYNSWEATEFNVNEAGQMALAEKAAALGIDRFVMDDGWFGQRKDDHAGLGDWYVNQQKFPHGLKALIDRVHQLGMDFGLWVEPEMVNPDSDLYRQHPEWVLNFPGRPRSEARNQLVLNLARPDVHAYVLSFLDKLLTENDIAFLKWITTATGASLAGISFPRRNRSAYMSSSRGTSMRSWPSCGTGTRMWRSNPAQAAADEWTWEFCATPTRFGPRITPTPSTS